MNYFNNTDHAQGYWQNGQQLQSLDAKVSAVMKQVYVKMFLALLVSAAAALLAFFYAPSITVASPPAAGSTGAWQSSKSASCSGFQPALAR